MIVIQPHKYDALDLARDAHELGLRHRVIASSWDWLEAMTTRPLTLIERAARWPGVDLDKLDAAWPTSDAQAWARYVLGDFPHRVEDGPWGTLGWPRH